MATVRARILPSGTKVWQVDYRDPAGKRRSKQFDLKRDADAYLTKAQHEVGRGTHVADSASITVAEAAKLWQERAANDGLERSTLNQYRQHVDYHIVPRIGGVKLNKMTAPAAQAFADALAKDVSRAMVKKVLVSLSSIFAEAQRRGKVGTNPIKAVKVRTSKRDAKDIEMPTKAELRAILAATPEKHRPFIYVATFTGMRSSELRGLSWEDVDLKSRVIHVRRRADRYNKISFPKSEAGTRDIPLPPIVVSLLTEWQKVCPKGDLNLVFPTGTGGVENHGNLLNRVFWPIQIAAGVAIDTGKKDENGNPVLDAKFSLHALRHAAVSLFIEQGWPAKKVQDVMGHASITMTYDVYGKLFESKEDDLAAMAAIENSLLPT
jgi:integrase